MIRVRMLAFWTKGQLGNGFQYELAGTPCETVIGQQIRHYSRDVAELFPHDDDLKRLNVQCYLGSPLFDSSGQAIGILVIMDDKEEETNELLESALLRVLSTRAGAEIERQRIEAVVRRNESWLNRLVETTQDAFISINRQGSIVRFNAAAEKIFGYSRAEVESKPVQLLMPEPYANEHDSYIERYERTGEPHAIGRIRSVAAKRKNGDIFPIELSVTEVEADEEVHYGAFIRDISDKVQLQEQLVERERLATIGTTAAKLSHEIGNPLNGMSANAQLLERRLAKLGTDADEKLSTYVHNIGHGIERLSQLLQEFRSLSRREKFYFEATALPELIDQVLRAETSHYVEQGISVQQECPAGLPPIVLDSQRMKQVMLNLYKNAVEAMPDGGTLTIGAYQAEKSLVCEISDTGVGISGNENIFDPFVTTKTDGTGLGLAIVQQIVAAHGGKITYTSQNGQGTTFTLTLPLVPPGASLETA